jgi:hypothetical protein
MTTKLDKALRREVLIKGEPWIVTITPDGVKLTEKGGRKGVELAWKDLVSGDAALAAALNASLRAAPEPRKTAAASPRKKGPRRMKGASSHRRR